MDNIQYCQMIVKSEPDEIDTLKPCLSSFVWEVKTEVEDDACNQSEIQDTNDDSKQDNSNISCDEIIANVGKKVTATEPREIEKGRLEKVVENITKETQIDRISKKVRYTDQERSEMIVKSFLSGHKGSLTPIHYKGVVLTKEPNLSHYNVKTEDLDRFKNYINGTEMYSCDDCNYTTNYFAMFKLHFMTHANMKFLTECMNLYSVVNYCFVCDFKSSKRDYFDRHINEHRKKPVVQINEKSTSDSKVVQPTVGSSTIPLEDASVMSKRTSAENTQNPNGTEDSEKPKRSNKYSTSRRKLVAKKNNGVKKSKNLTVKVRERHVDELRPNVTESSGVSLNGKSFRIEITSAAENSKNIQNVNESSGNITKGRKQTSRQIKTCSKRSPVVDMMNVIRNSEYENFDEEADYKDYDDENDFHDVQEDAVDNSAPQDAMLSCHVEVMPSCVVKIENDPDIAAAVCSNDKVYFKITNDNRKLQITIIPSELTRHPRQESNVCDKCHKICPNEYILKQHINSHYNRDHNDGMFGDGNGFRDVQEDTVDSSVPDAIPLRFGEVKNDPDIAAAVCVKDEVCFETTNMITPTNRHVEHLKCNNCDFVAKVPSELQTHTCNGSYACHLCGKLCPTGSAMIDHVNSHRGNNIICLSGEQYQCCVCNIVRSRNHIKRHIHSKHCTPDKKICGLKHCVEVSTVEIVRNDCSQKFIPETALEVHIDEKDLKSHRKESHVCQLCGINCRTKFILEGHMSSHNWNAICLNDKQYKCGLCNVVRNKKGIKVHIHAKHCTPDNKICGSRNCTKGNGVEFICNDCSQKFVSKFVLRVHIYKEHYVGPAHSCDLCKKLYKTRGLMQQHRRNHFCSSCPFQSNSIEETTEHARTQGHTLTKKLKPLHSCELCEYKTKDLKKFKWHMFKHKNPKRYACSQCDYKTEHKGTFLTHEKSHISVMTFSCTLCTFQTKRHDSLLKHKKTHGPAGEVSMIEDVSTRDPGLFYCDKCEYKTKYRMYFKAHKRKHDNIRPYLCPVCGAAFYSTHELHLHNKFNHLKPQPSKYYKCSYCDYTYHVHSSVLVHERKHTSLKPHQCDSCTFSTSYSWCLTQHKKRKHRTASAASS